MGSPGDLRKRHPKNCAVVSRQPRLGRECHERRISRLGCQAIRMRLLVLGKNGQVGWELQRALAPLGEVVALGRAEADLEDPQGLKRAIDAASPDVIVNASA